VYEAPLFRRPATLDARAVSRDAGRVRWRPSPAVLPAIMQPWHTACAHRVCHDCMIPLW